MRTTLCKALVMGCSLLAVNTGFAEINEAQVETRSVDRTIQTADGRTIEVRRDGQTDHEGDARARRGYRVTDASGEVVARGKDRARRYEDGRVNRGKKREFTTPDGNTIQKRARGQKDVDGRVRGHREGRRFDADGNVNARARDRGRRNSQGMQRHSQAEWQDGQGRKHQRKRTRRSR